MGLFRKKDSSDSNKKSNLNVEGIFNELNSQMRYSSLIKFCKQQIKDACCDNERCFWLGQLSTVYTLFGDGTLANYNALTGAEFAQSSGFINGLIHCASQLTVVPDSPEQMEKFTLLLERYSPNSPATGRAQMMVAGMHEGIALKDGMLLAAGSTESLGNAGKGQACAIVSILLRKSDAFRLNDEEYRKMLLYYSSNINMLANSARATLIEAGDDDYREYLPILHPAIRLLALYAGNNSYDEEVQLEYSRICINYGLSGDPANKGKTLTSFESLNHVVQKCRRCGMPVTGDNICLFCGVKY